MHRRLPRLIGPVPLPVSTLPALLAIVALLALSGGPTLHPAAADDPPAPVTPTTTVAADSRSPAAPSRYQVTFVNGGQSLRPPEDGVTPPDGIVMTLAADIRVPSPVSPAAVQVHFRTETATAAGVATAVSLAGQDDPGQPTTLTIVPRIPGRDADDPPQAIPAGASVTVIFTPAAGIANPAEGGAFAWAVGTNRGLSPTAAAHPDPAVRQAFGEKESPTAAADLVTGLLVDREIRLSRPVAARDGVINVIGRGYQNGATLVFWRDADFDGRQDSGETELCRAEVGGNHIGACNFPVYGAPFVPGHGNCAVTPPADSPRNCNFVNGAAGEGNASTLVIDAAAIRDNSVRDASQVLELDRTAVPLTTVASDTRSPAAATRYEVTFINGSQPLRPIQDGIVITLHADIRVPRQVMPQAVQVRYQHPATASSGAGIATAVSLDGQDSPNRPTTLTVFPLISGLGDTARPRNIPAGARVTVIFTPFAGLANPTEGGAFTWQVGTTRGLAPAPAAHPDPAVRQAFGETESPTAEADLATGLLVDREVQLSRRAATRDNTITVIGRGYKNGTTLVFWRDANFDGRRDSGETELCRAEVGGNDIATCDFHLDGAPFVPGYGNCAITPAAASRRNCNFVNGADGQGSASTLVIDAAAIRDNSVRDASQTLELEGTVAVKQDSPIGPGSPVLVRLSDFPQGQIVEMDIGGVAIDLSRLSPNDLAVPSSGRLILQVELPNLARPGYQSLRVVSVDELQHRHEARVNLLLGSVAQLRVTPPEEARPNQRISLAGFGFTRSDNTARPVELATLRIGGHVIDPARINGGVKVVVDDAGSWTASLDLPVNEVTTRGGDQKLEAVDTADRTGTATIRFPEREVDITPPWGRPGALAVVQGRGFPARNEHGAGANVVISYVTEFGQTVVNAEANGSGQFSVNLRIPVTTPAPSDNTVLVEFVDDNGVRVSMSKTHHVPQAALVLTPAFGPPGTALTIAGQGFRPYTPVSSALLGSIDLTPAPRPMTDENGNLTLKAVVPGVDTGLQNVTVTVGEITASVAFNITLSGAAPGPPTPVAEAVENLEERFVRLFYFDNDAKTWGFYDPAAGVANTVATLTTGESYWLLVTETTQAVLNNKTRQLTCVGGNCWNLLVW